MLKVKKKSNNNTNSKHFTASKNLYKMTPHLTPEKYI